MDSYPFESLILNSMTGCGNLPHVGLLHGRLLVEWWLVVGLGWVVLICQEDFMLMTVH